MDFIANNLKTIIFAVIAFLIAGIGLGLYFVIESSADRMMDQATGQLDSIASAEFSSYMNKRVTGGDVFDAANKYKNRTGVSIYVETGLETFHVENSDGICYDVPSAAGDPVDVSSTSCGTTATIQEMGSTVSDYYVNRTGRFDAQVYMDGNGEPRLIHFEQQ